jgi:DNA polymerase-3 subunit alpha (Gram-positive type)
MPIRGLELIRFFDCEATGLDTHTAEIIEVGIVSTDGVKFSERARPKLPVPMNVTELTGITDQDLLEAQSEHALLLKVHKHIREAQALGGYFIHLDIEYLRHAYSRTGLSSLFAEIATKPCICAKTLSKIAKLPLPEDYSLLDLCEVLKVSTGTHHSAYDDAVMSLEATRRLAEIIGANSLEDLISIQGPYVQSPWEHPEMSSEKKNTCRKRWMAFVESTRKPK